MHTWFKFTFPSGCVRWVHSNKGFVGLIPYIQTIPQRMYDGTTIQTVTKLEEFKCYLKNNFGYEGYIDLDRRGGIL